MNKSTLISKVSKETGLSQIIVGECLKSILNVILNTLNEGDKVSINKFGSFSVKTHNEKKMINPQNGKPYTVPSKKVIKFRSTSNAKLDG